MSESFSVVVTADQLRHRIPGGIGVYTQGLLRGLTEIAVVPTVVLSRGPYLSEALGMVPRDRVIHAALPQRALSKAWDLGWPLSARARRGAQIVHATSLSTPGRGRRSGRVPLSVFIHDVSFLRFPDAYPTRGLSWHRSALVRARQRADVVLVPSSTVHEQLVDDGFREDRIFTTGEGADHLPLHARTGDGSFILAVGTLQPRKNLERLIQSYARVRERLPQPSPLKIVGPSGWGELSLQPTEGVEWLGSVSNDELARLYADARVFAYVPLDEGFGLPVVEAQRAGVPVVASTGTPSAARDPLSCLLVEATDVEQMSEALLRAATDQTWRAATVAHALATVSEHTWARCAAAHVEAWSTCES